MLFLGIALWVWVSLCSVWVMPRLKKAVGAYGVLTSVCRKSCSCRHGLHVFRGKLIVYKSWFEWVLCKSFEVSVNSSY